MPQFHEIVMGRRFIEGTIPSLVEAINNMTQEMHELNTNLKVQEANSDDFRNKILDAFQYGINIRNI